jgi:hypothetical protein
MIKSFAKIENNIVVHVGIADDTWPFGDDPRIEIPTDMPVVPGWEFNGSTFVDTNPQKILPIQSDLTPGFTSSAVQMPAGDFYDRFTQTEQVVIATAAQTTPMVRVWIDRLLVRQTVVFADPRLSAGMEALVAAGLITQERSEIILPLNMRSSGVTAL